MYVRVCCDCAHTHTLHYSQASKWREVVEHALRKCHDPLGLKVSVCMHTCRVTLSDLIQELNISVCTTQYMQHVHVYQCIVLSVHVLPHVYTHVLHTCIWDQLLCHETWMRHGEHVHMRECMYPYTCIYAYIHIHWIYMYMHVKYAYMHTWMHIHLHTQVWFPYNHALLATCHYNNTCKYSGTNVCALKWQNACKRMNVRECVLAIASKHLYVCTWFYVI